MPGIGVAISCALTLLSVQNTPITSPRAEAAKPAPGATLPAWWSKTQALKNLDAQFTQSSESSIFGTMKKKGRLQLSKPGKLKVIYEDGLQITSNGSELVQFDPQTRTASRTNLGKALQDVPLLNLLMDASRLYASARIEVLKDTVTLDPQKPGNPKVELQGQGLYLKRVSWVDGTGARQTLELREIKTGPIPASTFKLSLPPDTRWVGR